MVRTLAILMLMTPAVGMAQEPIVPGQTLLGALGPGDRTLNGRAYDDYRYSAIPGAQARVVVRSRQLAADLNIYFYDDYFDMPPWAVRALPSRTRWSSRCRTSNHRLSS